MWSRVWWLFAMALFACVRDGYPLGTAGAVEVRVDVAGALFAADLLDDQGQPSGTRQTPYSSGVKLFITENNAPAFGSFVTVRVEPAEALSLESDASETGQEAPSCAPKDGAFRCTATKEGFARLVATSKGEWSGTAKLVVTWANLRTEQPIEILPAGIPDTATNFQIIGIDPSQHILASFEALICTVDAVPEDLGSEWRDGSIRSRQVYVRATAPADAPGVLDHAPVTVETLSQEAAISLDETCANRQPRIRVQLDQNGQSPPFYACFSDIGGAIDFGVASGAKIIDPNPVVQVDAEPRLLRVAAITTETQASFLPIDLFEVSTYSADRVQIPTPVDLKIEGDDVLQLTLASVTLSDDSAPATIISAIPKAVGTARLHVTPRLLSMPDCSSPFIDVVP